MNEHTSQLIGQFAQDSRFLILLNQAPFEATIQLFQTILIGIYGIVLWKIHKRMLKKEDNVFSENFYEKHDLAVIYPMAFAGLTFFVLALALFASIGDIYNGYFNPEYWALQKIMKGIN